MKKQLLIIIFCFGIFFALASQAQAANVYVTPNGTGDGSDWAHPKSFPLNGTQQDWQNFWVRGNIYYVASGDYIKSPVNQNLDYVVRFNEPSDVNGTKIIVKKATEGDHGINTGWATNDSRGIGAAVFSADVPNTIIGYNTDSDGSPIYGDLMIFYFTTSNWEIDGMTGDKNNEASYGIKLRATGQGLGPSQLAGTNREATSPIYDITFKHINFNQRLRDIDRRSGIRAEENGISWYSSNGIYNSGLYVEDCYFHDSFSVFVIFNYAENVVFNRCWFARNQSSPAENWHAEAFQNHANGYPTYPIGSRNVTIKNCHFSDVEGTSYLSLGNTQKWYIYGNIFDLSPNYPAEQQNNWEANPTNIVINVSNSTPSSDIYIFNNTIYNLRPCLSNCPVEPFGTMDNTGGGVYDYRNDYGAVSPNVYIFNNLWASSRIIMPMPSYGYLSYPTLTNSYNGWYDITYNNDENLIRGQYSQVFSSNPFQSTSYANASYLKLKANTNQGIDPHSIVPQNQWASLSGYNIDPAGTLRTNWDRGAYEYTTTPTCLTPGDFTCNGYSISDLQTMISIILGTDTTTSYTQADMSTPPDGLVNISDLQLLIKKVLGIN